MVPACISIAKEVWIRVSCKIYYRLFSSSMLIDKTENDKQVDLALSFIGASKDFMPDAILPLQRELIGAGRASCKAYRGRTVVACASRLENDVKVKRSPRGHC